MSARLGIYRGLSGLLALYALAAIVLAADPGGRAGGAGALFYLAAHAFLLGMSGVRMARPAVSGTTGSLLLTLAMATALAAGVGMRGGPGWFPPLRIIVLAVAYVGLRATAPPRAVS